MNSVALNVNNYFNYALDPCSNELTTESKIASFAITFFATILTGGVFLAILYCYKCFYENQGNMQDHAETPSDSRSTTQTPSSLTGEEPKDSRQISDTTAIAKPMPIVPPPVTTDAAPTPKAPVILGGLSTRSDEELVRDRAFVSTIVNAAKAAIARNAEIQRKKEAEAKTQQAIADPS